MSATTKIEWTDATWTPVKGCTRHSPGCVNCYAEIMAARFSKPGQWGEGLAEIVTTPQGKDHRWTGKVRFDEKELLKPLRWKRPRKIFVCSTADLFHESVEDEWIDRVFAVMALCPQHTFQVLTKRSARMREYLTSLSWQRAWPNNAREIRNSLPRRNHVSYKERHIYYHEWGLGYTDDEPRKWSLPNVWLGVSVEDQTRADERIPDLLATPAAIRWISAEPLLGPVDLSDLMFREEQCPNWEMEGSTPLVDPETGCQECCKSCDWSGVVSVAAIDWVVCGGESGPGARPIHPDWARSLRDQCASAGVAFLFKQWGEWGPAVTEENEDDGPITYLSVPKDGFKFQSLKAGVEVREWKAGNWKQGGGYSNSQKEGVAKVGKKRAGRLLDGVLHDGYLG